MTIMVSLSRGRMIRTTADSIICHNSAVMKAGRVELRDVEIFLALAEELHFGRTAERLHVTQARVSQAIKKQERHIGGALFERSSRRVTLTPIGKQLYEDLAPLYRGFQESLRRATAAARGKTTTLRLGMISTNQAELKPLFDLFTARHPECETQVRVIGFDDPFGPLRRDEVDVSILWLPVREPDLTTGPVAFTEPVVLALAIDHPLAARGWATREDLGDTTVIGGARPDYWREGLVPAHTPRGRPIRIGPVAANLLEMTPFLAAGEAVSPMHSHASRYYPHPQITYIPITDAPPAQWALIWRTATETSLTRDFARAVRDVGPLAL
ncbi:LysR family transcriptional regulator [Nocardia sp. NPDC050712]|uniref:LysR family transcriptional regulator n=1 Tax=Nocardia sp. NPDC050712 TaxID=3155518 RepID=UPI003402795C